MSGDNPQKKFITRRDALKGLSLAGAAGTIALGYQNCGGNPAVFKSGETSSGSEVCKESLASRVPTCEASGNILNGKPVNAATPGDEHALLVRLCAPTHFDHAAGASKTQHLLLIDVGSDVTVGSFHPTDYRDFKVVHSITDIFVVDTNTCRIILWKQFSMGDQTPSAFMMLDDEHVQSGKKLKVIAACSTHGFFGLDVDLGTLGMTNYAEIVAPFNQALPFGGTAQHPFPYIALSATGGQGDLGVLHAPLLVRLNDNEMTVILGGSTPHDRYGDDHYIHGAALFDQNGHMLSAPVYVRYREATPGPLMTFKNLKLSERGVTHVRAVIFDTLNGYLQGFLKLS